jgi:hypothetical protein
MIYIICMSEIQTPKDFENDLRSIKDEIAFIKDNMADKDSIMTEDDYEALIEYRKDKQSNKLTSHEDLKKELGI